MRAIDQEVFMVAATFSGDGDGPVEVRMVPFADCVRKDIGYFLNEQYQTFLKMKEVEYNGHYKADKDECLCINIPILVTQLRVLLLCVMGSAVM